MGLTRGDRVRIKQGPDGGKTGRVVFCDIILGLVTVSLDDSIASYLHVQVPYHRCEKIDENWLGAW